jgi:uncharacterized DUF497 family protein
MLESRVIWDLDEEPNGNVHHIKEHGITKDDVEDVLFNVKNETATSRSSGEKITFGYTQSGVYLAVIWQHIDDNPLTMRPITAYAVREPKKKRKRGDR